MNDTARRRLSCIMFTDTVGYGALAQADEQGALALMAEQLRLLRPILRQHGGREIKTLGDGLLVEFDSAVRATQCAIAMQRAVQERNRSPESQPFQVRIGLHIGDIVRDRGDVHGDGVNIASRIEACAPAGGIALTGAVAQQVGNKLDHPLVFMGRRRLKHVAQPVPLYRVAVPWDAGAVAAHARLGRWWRRFDRQRAALVLLAIALVAGGAAWWATRSPPPITPGDIRSLAVLPLDDLADDPAGAYFVEGMHDALISELSQIGALRVISRTSTLKYATERTSAPEIARELDVDVLVEGSVLRAGDSVRVSVQLVGARADTTLWSRRYERELRTVLALQAEIASQIADEIRVKLTPQERRRLATNRAVDPDAHEAYLRGRWYRDRGSPEDLDKAHEQFQRAIDVDPTYAPAHVGMATYWSLLPFYSDRSPASTLPRARAAILRALELDESLAEAHGAMAYVRAYFDLDWDGAEREFRRAIELSPSSADVHFSYSRFLATQERFEEAHTALRRAYELDPLSLLLKANIALLHYFERDYERSLAVLHEILEIDPEFATAHWGLGLVYEQQRRFPAALAAMEKAAGASGPNVRSSLGHLYGVAGRRSDAERVLAELSERARGGYLPSYFLGLVHAGLGDRDAAIEHLERAYQERSSILAYLLIDPRLDDLRGDPRFDSLRRRLRLPEKAPGARAGV